MKRIILTTLALSFISTFQSCSNDDNTNSNNQNYFLNVQFDGQSFSQDRPDIDFLIPWCNWYEIFTDEEMEQQGLDPLLKGELITTNVGQIETSQYFINVTMAYLESADSFNAFSNYFENSNEYDWNDSAFISSSEYFDFNDCLFNNVFIVDFAIGNDELNIAFPASLQEMSFSQPQMVNETSTEITYALSGEFNLDFINTDNTTLNLTGQFRFPVYVLK
jgi:hypothetical protein